MKSEIELYADEALESFLLRLSARQGYERFAHFAEDIWHATLVQHQAIPGAFPFELRRVNLYKAKVTSQMRVRVFIDLENQLRLTNFGVLRLALSHSKSVFSPDYKAVNRDGIDYPHIFVRKQFTPVCPQCLAVAPYIRQQWQFVPYKACSIHQCQLLERCPSCNSLLDYQSSGLIEHCACGFDLTHAQPGVASEAEKQVSRWLSGEAEFGQGIGRHALNVSTRFGFLLWYVNRSGSAEKISFDDFADYCNTWPKRLVLDLDSISKKSELIRISPWNKIFFTEAFGPLLKDCRQLPSRDPAKNPVLGEVISYLIRLVALHPKQRQPNIADVLLSILEVSTLLSCSTDEVHRLYQFGELKADRIPKQHQRFAIHDSVFTLRSVVEMKLVRMMNESDGLYRYLPEW